MMLVPTGLGGNVRLVLLQSGIREFRSELQDLLGWQ